MARRAVRSLLGAIALTAASLILTAPFASATATNSTERTTPEQRRLAGVEIPASVLSGTKISHATAVSRLRGAGITIWSSGGCSDRNNPNCTSFEQVNSGTIDQIIVLRNASGCPINVTGGTETGHGGGTYSHWNGYKLDISRGTCIEGYIRTRFTKVVPPSFGEEQWKSAAGNIYTNEGNHWDILYW